MSYTAYYRKIFFKFAFCLGKKFLLEQTFPISSTSFNSTNSSVKAKGPTIDTSFFFAPPCPLPPPSFSLSYHEYQVVPRQPVVRLLEDGLQQQRVLGQPLHRPHEDVEEAEPVAVLLRLAPRQVGLEDLVLAVLVAAVLLAVGLLGAVTRVRREDLLELRKRRKRKISFFVAAAAAAESIESINEMIQVES